MSQLIDRLRTHHPRILVVGDVMLDHYRIADATRISPEAPVPVLLNPRDEYRLGGAGAVAAMCAALGANVCLISVTGPDADSNRLNYLLEQANAGPYLIGEPGRVTTVKERICGVASGRHRQQLARIDSETTHPICADLSARIAGMICDMTGHVDLIIVADYDKGIMTPQVAQACIAAGPCIVDPPRNNGWHKYRGAACLVPNRQEANGSTPLDLVTEYQLQAAVVKLDQDGCRLQDDQLPMVRAIHANARAVHDVTGAGDQFIATLGCARAVGAGWFDAAQLANKAAGLQVERHGCIPITISDLAKVNEQNESAIQFITSPDRSVHGQCQGVGLYDPDLQDVA